MDLKEPAALLLPAGDYLIGSPSSTIENTAGTKSACGEQEKGCRGEVGGIGYVYGNNAKTKKSTRLKRKFQYQISKTGNIILSKVC